MMRFQRIWGTGVPGTGDSKDEEQAWPFEEQHGAECPGQQAWARAGDCGQSGPAGGPQAARLGLALSLR